MPECEYPGCDLTSRARYWLRAIGEHRHLCTLHTRWDGTVADHKAGADACRAALGLTQTTSEETA